MSSQSAAHTLPETFDTAVRDAVRALTRANVAAPQEVAQRIVCEAAQCSMGELLLHAQEPLPGAAATRYQALLTRALTHEPLSRILGEREFYGRMFELNAETLDPRADTETLIEGITGLGKEMGWYDRPFRVLDVGTGTGCIAITLLCEFPTARAVATDISDCALDAARRNAHRHRVSDRIEFLNCRSLEGIEGPFDLLVSNPPYVRSQDIPTLSPAVRNFDPHAALDGGADGLATYREIATGLSRTIPDGWAVFEVGAGMAAEVTSILGAQRSSQTRQWKDLSGHIRGVAVKAHCA